MLSIWISNRNGKHTYSSEFLCVSLTTAWPCSFAYERQLHLLRSALHPSALSSGKSHDHDRIRYFREQSDPLSYLASNPRPSSFTAIEISLGSQRQRTWTCFPGFS